MLLFALLWACSDTILNEVKKPSIIVAPELLDFGHLLSGLESDTMTITISNGGTADLIVDHLELEGANYLVDTTGFVVPAGRWYQIEVGYSPETFEHNEGYIDIYLEGDEEPSESVWLNGNGDAPLINVMPADYDFGAPLLGCDVTKEIIIQNDGNVDLVITDIDIMASVLLFLPIMCRWMKIRIQHFSIFHHPTLPRQFMVPLLKEQLYCRTK